MLRTRFSAVHVALAAILFVPAPAAADHTLPITYPSGAIVQAELADTPHTRAQGLMFRKQLAPDAGMLFRFEQTGAWSFWMKNTHIALDILWIGPDKTIVSIATNVPPCRQDPCPHYATRAHALYALELPAGAVTRHRLATGMTLTFDLPK